MLNIISLFCSFLCTLGLVCGMGPGVSGKGGFGRG